VDRIGIVGGIGPESTIDYYRLLLARFRARGMTEAPDLVLHSIDLARLLALAAEQDRAALTEYLLRAVEVLARAGATVGLFAANTPHLVFDEVQLRASIPLLSIVTATCDAAQDLGWKRAGLLGTRFTMVGGFYQEVMAQRGIQVFVPLGGDQDYVHDKYLQELVKGQFLPETRAGFLARIDTLRARESIDGVILGGTELPLLLREAQHPLPFLDTTQVHVDAVVAHVLSGGPG